VLIIELSSEKHALQNIQNDCYEGLPDSGRVHQIRFRPLGELNVRLQVDHNFVVWRRTGHASQTIVVSKLS